MGIRVGLVARPTAKEAWTVALADHKVDGRPGYAPC